MQGRGRWLNSSDRRLPQEEGRRQRAEGRRQKAEVGRAEIGRAEDRKADIGSQRSEVRNCEVRDNGGLPTSGFCLLPSALCLLTLMVLADGDPRDRLLEAGLDERELRSVRGEVEQFALGELPLFLRQQ